MVLKIQTVRGGWKFFECKRFSCREVTISAEIEPDVQEIVKGLYGDRALLVNYWEVDNGNEVSLLLNTLMYVMEKGKTVDAIQLATEEGAPLRMRY